MHTWLDGTDSGRYVLLPEAALPAWEWETADEWMGEYAAAFDLPGHGDVLVLAGEPLSVTWLAEASTFARWYTADGDTGLLAAVEAVTGGWQDVCTVELGGRYLLVDSAYDGERLTDLLAEPGPRPELLPIDIPFGRYRVQSLTLTIDPENEFLLDRLLPV